MAEKLRNAVKRYLDADTGRKESAAKGLITKAANELGDLEKIWDVLREFEGLPDWMHQRFTRGSQYLEGDRLFGWYAEYQIQAEALPMLGLTVNFYGFKKELYLWKQRGFEEPEKLPVTYYSDSIWVSFPVEKSPFMARYGYALPCELQWKRSDLGEALEVTRSIIPYGFWQAWKWSENARWWYLEHRPELFADSEWWETKSKRWEPENDPYAVVLGGTYDKKPPAASGG